MGSADQPRTRDTSKQAQVIAMLKRADGTTITQICEATGWLPHTVRGTFAGTFKKRLGLTIISGKDAGGARVYRVQAGAFGPATEDRLISWLVVRFTQGEGVLRPDDERGPLAAL